MNIYIDDPDKAGFFFSESSTFYPVNQPDLDQGFGSLVHQVFSNTPVFQGCAKSSHQWKSALIVQNTSCSHYDILIDLCRKKVPLGNKLVCLAGRGTNFHGQRNRSWKASKGNIHLTALFCPDCEINEFGAGFLILPAISIVETIDCLSGMKGKAKIKWVNDILLDGAKVAGFLAFSQSKGSLVEKAVLGIGLNVETDPCVETDDFVPKASYLRKFLSDPEHCTLSLVLDKLLERLESNYETLLAGKISTLLEIYRERSVVLGKEVTIMSDPLHGDPKKIVHGKVESIGSNLELFLQNRKRPITSGRLIVHI